MFEVEVEEEKIDNGASIKVIGVGGAGGNTVNSMINSDTQSIEFIVANTDSQALKLSKSTIKIQMGAKLTKGLGSGALPVIARALKDRSILSIAIVTRPFSFEGKYRSRIAQEAIDLLSQEVDTLVVVSNQKLLETVDKSTSMIDAFAMINNVLYQSVKSIADIIINPGHINVDFADLRTIMKDMGLAVMGTGHACGSQRAQEAALQAIASPLLEN